MLVKLMIGDSLLTVISVYAPQTGLEQSTKDTFYDNLQAVISKLGDNEIVIPCGDWNGHVGKEADGYEGVHGGIGFGDRNADGERILDFAVANDFVIGNTFFVKRDSHLITYQSGPCKTQIDFILLKSKHLRMVKDIKVIPSEECAPQHKLLIGELQVKQQKLHPKSYTPKLRSWKLKEPTVQEDFKQLFASKVEGFNSKGGSTEEIWNELKTALLDTTNQTCGKTKKLHRRRETWWWNDGVNTTISEKRRCWKAWKQGGDKEQYLQAKRVARRTVYLAKKTAEEKIFSDLKPGMTGVYKIAKLIRKDSQDVVGDKCVNDDSGQLSVSDESKKNAWKQHYERLLNEEFPWNSEELNADPVEGAPVQVDVDMVTEAIAKMKPNKAAGPSGIVAEMLKASGEAGVRLVVELANAIIRNGDVPSDWEDSYIINTYKGKGDALERGNYRGLKLLDQVMKCIERVVEKIIRERISIDEMQFGFMPGRGTTDAIFILRHLQEKHLAKNKRLYFAFVDLEKAFDRVPRKVIWWAMRKLGLEEWIVRLVQAMYKNTTSRIRVNDTYSDAFGVKVGVHQGSVLSKKPLLFVIVLEALSCEFRTGAPWELLYADDLVIVAESEEELKTKLSEWKNGMEAKGLRVNMGKTKILISGVNLNTLKDSGKYPCSVCRKGVGSNSIFCSGCSYWVHKKCSGIKGALKTNHDYQCSRCLGLARPIDNRPIREWYLDEENKLDVVDSFCYLGDMVGAGGGCELGVTNRIRSAWGKFRELLPILTSRSLSYVTRGKTYSTYIRSVLLYASECWTLKADDLHKLQRNDRAMIRWICNVRLEERVSSLSLLKKLGIVDLETLITSHRLRWYGHVQRSDNTIKQITNYDVTGPRPRGRPKKTWSEMVKADIKKCNMTNVDPLDRDVWRNKLRTVISSCATYSE